MTGIREVRGVFFNLKGGFPDTPLEPNQSEKEEALNPSCGRDMIVSAAVVTFFGWATKSIQDRTGLVNDGKMFYYREKER